MKFEHKLFFLKLFGQPRDVPTKFRDIPPKSLASLGFKGHTELFGPPLFTWKTPTPPEDIRTQMFGFMLLFLAWKLLFCLVCVSHRLASFRDNQNGSSEKTNLVRVKMQEHLFPTITIEDEFLHIKFEKKNL